MGVGSDLNASGQPCAPSHCLMLLGDSRDRYLFHDLVDISCPNATHLNWSRCLGNTLGRSSLDTSRIIETVGGAMCHPPTLAGQVRVRFLAHLTHFGVAGDRYHERFKDGAWRGWTTHPHPGWGGDGWRDAHGSVEAHANSPRLIIEAAQRFLAASKRLGCKHRSIVFSSFMWDVFRHVDHFPSLPPQIWGDEFEANYTSVANELKLLVESTSAKLLLTLPFPPRPQPHHRNRTMSISDVLFHRVQRASIRLGLPLINLSRPYTPSASSPALWTLYRDQMHQSPLGSQFLWTEIISSIHQVHALGSVQRQRTRAGSDLETC